MSISANKSTAGHAWLWALLPLLLAAALAIPLLGVDAFNGDEPSSLLAAGILHSGPLSLEATWSFITNSDPHQAYGWPLLLAIWGRLVGWSEVAVRALPLFAGCLTLAWVYRTGRDLFAPQAGLFAALLLSASVFFLAYHGPRARLHSDYPLHHALHLELLAHCAWIRGQPAWVRRHFPAARQHWLTLFALLHALFLPALGLFHLLFVPKSRRWWQPVLLLVLAACLPCCNCPAFCRDWNKTAGNEALHNRALTAPAVVSHFVHFMTNGLLDPCPRHSTHCCSSPCLSRWRSSPCYVCVALIRVSPLWLLAFTSMSVLAVMIVINEFIQVIVANRIRYLMPLWPLTALLVGAGLWRLVNRRSIMATGMLALWLIYGAWLTLATDFRYELGYFFRTDIRQSLPCSAPTRSCLN